MGFQRLVLRLKAVGMLQVMRDMTLASCGTLGRDSHSITHHLECNALGVALAGV